MGINDKIGGMGASLEFVNKDESSDREDLLGGYSPITPTGESVTQEGNGSLDGYKEKVPAPTHSYETSEEIKVSSEENKQEVGVAVTERQPNSIAVQSEQFFFEELESKSLDKLSPTSMKLFSSSTGGKVVETASAFMIPKDPNVSPIADLEIKDTSGRIGSIIKDAADQFEMRIVPSKLTRVPSWSDVSGFYSFNYKGEVYFAPEDIDWVVDSLVTEAVAYLKEGKAYVRPICKRSIKNGSTILQMLLSPRELSKVSSLLATYQPKILDNGETSDEPLVLVIGDYVV